MVVILFAVILAVSAVATSKIRHHNSFGSFTRYEMVRENIARARVRTEQSGTISPMTQFLVVVLPDGRVVNSRIVNLLVVGR
jgi:hypothetical protein